MKRPEKKVIPNRIESEPREFDWDEGYNKGFQDERDFRDWLVDNVDIKEILYKNLDEVGLDDFKKTAEIIHQLLKDGGSDEKQPRT